VFCTDSGMALTPDDGSRGTDATPPVLVVVVPARNEVDRVRECLGSLSRQVLPVKVFFSDNASDDGTLHAAQEFVGDLDLIIRSTSLLQATEHFVSAGRWALDVEPRASFFAFLAGDDSWSVAFARAAVTTLLDSPDVGAVFPAFVWRDAEGDRVLAPLAFCQRRPGARQRRALLLPDHRELANLAYGVHRRAAFVELLAAWERGGEHFAGDYAAAWRVLGSHKVAACPAAVGQRYVRQGADLIERVGLRRADARGPVATVRLYVLLNLRINRLVAEAIARAAPRGSTPPSWWVQLLRTPQWLWGALRQVRTFRSRTGSR
jgi:Glycosyl transferase family 2